MVFLNLWFGKGCGPVVKGPELDTLQPVLGTKLALHEKEQPGCSGLWITTGGKGAFWGACLEETGTLKSICSSQVTGRSPQPPEGLGLERQLFRWALWWVANRSTGGFGTPYLLGKSRSQVKDRQSRDQKLQEGVVEPHVQTCLEGFDQGSRLIQSSQFLHFCPSKTKVKELKEFHFCFQKWRTKLKEFEGCLNLLRWPLVIICATSNN